MPGVARLGDMAGGPIISGADNVFVNSRPVARLSDGVAPHPPTKPPVHTASPRIVSGSSTVFVNGRPIVRLGDGVSCGHSVSGASGNVFAK